MFGDGSNNFWKTKHEIGTMNMCLVMEMDDTAAIFNSLWYTCHVKDTYFWLHYTKPEQVF